MTTRWVVEKPAMTYRQASLAQAAAEQQYGGNEKAPKAPTDSSPRAMAHQREAHLEHRASARDLKPRDSSSGPRIGRRNPEDDYARAVSRTDPYGMRDAGLRSDAERRMLAGIESGDRAFIDEVARGIVDAGIDIPSLAGSPTNVGQAVLDAISKWGKGGGGQGGAGGRSGVGGVDLTLGGYILGTRGPAGGVSRGGRRLTDGAFPGGGGFGGAGAAGGGPESGGAGRGGRNPWEGAGIPGLPGSGPSYNPRSRFDKYMDWDPKHPHEGDPSRVVPVHPGPPPKHPSGWVQGPDQTGTYKGYWHTATWKERQQ